MILVYEMESERWSMNTSANGVASVLRWSAAGTVTSALTRYYGGEIP